MLNQGSRRDGAQLIMDTNSSDNSNLFTFTLKVQPNKRNWSEIRGESDFQQYSIIFISVCRKAHFLLHFGQQIICLVWPWEQR